MTTQGTYANESTPSGQVGLRDLRVEDIDRIVEYWHFSGDDHLDFMGIDRGKLGTPENTIERFHRAVPNGDPEQRSLALSITLDDKPVGYTLLNQFESEINYSHWHLIDKSVRRSGLSTVLYPFRIQAYFALTNMNRLIHLTRTRNIGVSRMLDKYVPIAETRHFDEPPGGVGAPGEFHIRYVCREDLPRILEHGADLRRAINSSPVEQS